MKKIKPTPADCRVIRDCAQRSARRRRVHIEIGERHSLTDKARNEAALDCPYNIALVTDDLGWDDTDLTQTHSWEAFKREGFRPASGGVGIVDFYVYEIDKDGPADLCTNVTATWEGGKLALVEGTSDGVMWKAP